MPAATKYCTRENVEEVYGEDNIRDWADINGTGDPIQIAARIEWTCKKAFTRINARLMRRNFALPFDDDAIPGVITDVASELAGYYMYSARMLDGGDRTSNNLSHMHKEAEKTLTMIVSGEIKIVHDLQDFTDAPFVARS